MKCPFFSMLDKAWNGGLVCMALRQQTRSHGVFLSEEWYNKSGYFEKMFLIETLDKLFLHAQLCTKPKQKISVQDGLIMEAEMPAGTTIHFPECEPGLSAWSAFVVPDKQTNKQKKIGKDVITKVIPASWIIPWLRTYDYNHNWRPVRLKERESQRPRGCVDTRLDVRWSQREQDWEKKQNKKAEQGA